MRRDRKMGRGNMQKIFAKKKISNRERLIKLLAQKCKEIWQCHSKAASEMYTRNQNQRLFGCSG